MDNFGEQHCRLCLSTVSEYFKELKDDTKSILDVLLLKLNLDNSSKYVICNVCSRRVMEAFTFKSMVVYTNNTIIPYIDDEAGCSTDIKEIYMKETEKKDLIPTLGDYEVCRFCMQLVKDKFISTHEMEVNIIDTYIPEINLTLTEDPVICRECFDSFVNHSNFIMKCLEINKKIKSFSRTEVVDDSIWMGSVDPYVKTEEVDIKCESKQEDDWVETCSAMEISVNTRISNHIMNNSEIKTEDENEKSEPTYSVSANDENHYNSSHDTNTFSHNSDIFQSGARNLLRHKYISRTEFQCEVCDYRTKRKSDLKKHQLTHKDISETELFECNACDYKTKRKGNLKIHQWIHKDMSETEIFKCDTCEYKSKIKGNLKRHQLTHKVSKMELFQCDACDFTTKRKGNLKIHKWKHNRNVSEKKVFKCDTCGYKTKVKSSLKQHQQTHKDISEVEGFVCGTCGCKIKHKKNLKMHLLTHKDVSETTVFECDSCDYRTKRKSDLKIHRIAHKEISEFECETCNFKTKYKKCLKAHRLTHKDISETEVFECGVCEFKTKYKNSLKKHLVMHKDIFGIELFECDTCGRKFRLKNRLKIHMLRKHRDLKL